MTAGLLLVVDTSSHIIFLEKLIRNWNTIIIVVIIIMHIPIYTSMYCKSKSFQFVISINVPTIIRPL